MNGRRLIALEGLPFTGKSTAAAVLHRGISAAAVIPDYHDMLPSDVRARMATLPQSADDQCDRLRIYKEIDDERWRSVGGLSAPLVIFDRCALSITAYSTALGRTFGDSLRCKSPGLMLTGDQPRLDILFFGVGLRVAVERHRQLSVGIDARLQSAEFLGNLIDAYSEALARSGNRVWVVDSSQTLRIVVRRVREYVDEICAA